MGLNILLVDDDATFSEVLTAALRAEGAQVTVARGGATAILLARELRPDVVLLDVVLPDVDGYDAVRVLRRELPAVTPIIVLTALREASLVEDVDLILHKPIPAELFGGLIEYIRRRRRHRITTPPRS